MNVASKVHAYAAMIAAFLSFSAVAQGVLDGDGITYSSERQGTLVPGSSTMNLQGKARAESKDFTLEAETIEIDWGRREIKAYGARQADGSYLGRPIFTQGDRRIGADTLRYNYGTQKGWVYQSSSQESGGFLFGKQVKMISDSSYYIGATRFTTCNHAEPHFAIVAPQARFDVGKRIVTGPAYLELAHLPTPLALPFGFFPMAEKRASGFILPNFADRREWGLGLTGFGHYWALNDHLDLKVTGDLYTRGSWGIQAQTNYRYRYRFSGGFTVQANRTRYGDPRYADYGQFYDARDYRISWNHNQDPKAHPTRTISARVELATGSFFKNTTTNPDDFLKNDLSSSVSLVQRFPGTPFTFTGALRHRQNNQQGTIALSLPEFNLGMARVQPFARKVRSGAPKWYEGIGLTYAMNGRNETQGLLEELQDPAELFDPARLRSGIQQSASVNTNLKLLRFITINPSADWAEKWYPTALNYSWDPDSGEVRTDTARGFFTAREFRASASANTTLYGLFRYRRGPVSALRHVMYPSVTAIARPDFSDPRWNIYQEIQSDSAGTLKRFNRFQGYTYGSPGPGQLGAVRFRLRNTLDAKLRASGDSGIERKINLIDDLSLETGYNAAAATNPWENIAVRASSSWGKGAYRVSYQGLFDWYGLDSSGVRTETFAAALGQGWIRPTMHQFSADVRLRGGTAQGRRGPKINDLGLEENFYSDYYAPLDHVAWAAPWSINAGYSMRRSAVGTTYQTTHSVRVDGTFDATQNWKIRFASGYDLAKMDFTFTSFDVVRTIHCWQMNLRWVPFGYARSYSIGMGVTAPLLNALKVQRRRGLGDY
ncbi:MAG: hypothetical protein RIR61_1181 [Bacteroidota bacterium]|jgi:hypothetical protein